MTIEGLGKKFQEAREARGLTLDEAARMTKIRPSRLAEIEADDFSQFPSLAYAKGFLLIYGKFLDVDVTPYMEAFETSDAVTVDGYSYLQDNPIPAPVRTPIVRRRPARVRAPSPASGERKSLMPLILGVVVIVAGFLVMKLLLNLQRLAPSHTESTPAAEMSPAIPQSTAAPSSETAAVVAASVAPSVEPVAPSPTAEPSATQVAAAVVPSPPPPSATPKRPEPEVRRADPVRPEDLANAAAPAATVAATAAPSATAATTLTATAAAAAGSGPNEVVIRPVRKTYVKVVVDDEKTTPAYERWLSPSDGTIEFRGQHINIRVLDREAIQIKKNGKTISDKGDEDVTVQ